MDRYIDLGDDCLLDRSQGSLIKDGFIISLSMQEFSVLKTFSARIGTLVSNEEIIIRVWGSYNSHENNNLYTVINRLRNKLEDNPSRPKCIITIRRRGYIFYKIVKVSQSDRVEL